MIGCWLCSVNPEYVVTDSDHFSMYACEKHLDKICKIQKVRV